MKMRRKRRGGNEPRYGTDDPPTIYGITTTTVLLDGIDLEFNSGYDLSATTRTDVWVSANVDSGAAVGQGCYVCLERDGSKVV